MQPFYSFSGTVFFRCLSSLFPRLRNQFSDPFVIGHQDQEMKLKKIPTFQKSFLSGMITKLSRSSKPCPDAVFIWCRIFQTLRWTFCFALKFQLWSDVLVTTLDYVLPRYIYIYICIICICIHIHQSIYWEGQYDYLFFGSLSYLFWIILDLSTSIWKSDSMNFS